jgi:hypothetical protein
VIDWLRGPPADPVIEIAGRALPIAIRRHARAKRLTMRLAPDGSEVRVTLPRWCAARDALVFAHARTDWLERQLAAVPSVAPPAPGGTLRYRGRELAIAWEAARRRRPAAVRSTRPPHGPCACCEQRRRRSRRLPRPTPEAISPHVDSRPRPARVPLTRARPGSDRAAPPSRTGPERRRTPRRPATVPRGRPSWSRRGRPARRRSGSTECAAWNGHRVSLSPQAPGPRAQGGARPEVSSLRPQAWG